VRRALYAAVLLFALHRALVPMRETDLFFHLKIGQLILEQHSIPFRNLFSFTYPDAVDPDLSWGFQVLVALAFRMGGFTAIVLLKALLFTAASALALAICRRSGAGPLASSAAVLLAICAADQRLVERPHLVTFVGIGVVGLLLEGKKWRVLPLAVLIWANFHAGVFLALILMAAEGIGAWLDGDPPPRRYWLLFAACAGSTFLTPAGTLLPSYLLWHTGLGATRIIEEFRRADPWSDPWFFTQLALALASSLALRQWRRILPAALVALLAYRSVRFVAEWAFLSAPLCALGLTQFARTLALRSRPAIAAVAIVALIAVERRDFDVGLGADVVPFSAIDFVTREQLRARLYVNLDVGCYLLWEGWPRWSVFQDARLPAYPDDFHRALDQTPSSQFDALLRRYDVDAALISDPDVDMRAGDFDPDEWALVWRSSDALVFTRRLPERRELISHYEIPLQPRFAFDGGTHFQAIPHPPPRSPVAECVWQKRLVTALADIERPDRAVVAQLSALESGCLDDHEREELRQYVARSYGWKVRIGK
jgi:hypothetical protein